MVGEGPRKAWRGSDAHPPASPLPLAGSSICPAGYNICYHPQAVSQVVNSMDTNLLLCSKQPRVPPAQDPQPHLPPHLWRFPPPWTPSPHLQR